MNVQSGPDPLPEVDLSAVASSCLWGKTTVSGDLYPLLGHLLDTAAVLIAYLEDGRLGADQVEHLARLCGVSATELTGGLPVLAALHDVGKATHQFQHHPSLGDSQRTLVADRLGNLPDSTTGDDLPDESLLLRRHALVSGVAAHRHRCHGAVSYSADVVAGHHGSFPQRQFAGWDPTTRRRGQAAVLRSGGMSLWDPDTEPTEWVTLWEVLRRRCVDVIGAPPLEVWHIAAVPFVTQLVVLADWVASSRLVHGAPTHLLSDHPDRFLHHQVTVARRVLGELFGDTLPDTSGRSFAELFPKLSGSTPRPLQQQVMDLPGGRGLTIIAAPMGVGKTEAALIRAFSSSSGLYFALPTGATAKTMFDRVLGFVTHLPDGGRVAANLLHRNSRLNDFYRESDPEVGEENSLPFAQRWLSGRHKALLAPVGVGTVDRILQGVMPHRYGFMKLGALAGRTVVLDEVHAYDAYTAGLLARLVEWLAVAGADVIVLSATLPTAVHDALHAAYRRGLTVADLADRARPVPTGAGYPQVTYQGADGSCRTKSVASPEHTLCVEYSRGALVDELLTRLDDAGPVYAALLLNRVTDAQAAAEELSRRLPDAEVHVLHSRMTARHREEATGRILAAFGKGRPDRTTRHVVLVATQVAEMSLDIDVDVMVSALAPLPALLQRSGRLWRHERGTRPVDRRILVVGALPERDGDALPYRLSELCRTYDVALDSGRRDEISVPGDVQRLVDAAFVPRDVDVTESVGNAVARGTADLRSLPHCDEVDQVAQFTEGSAELDPNMLVTRLGQDTTGVLLVGDSPWVWSGALPDSPTPDEQLELLGSVVPLGGHLAAWARSCSVPVPEGWSETAPALDGLLVVPLGEGTVVYDDDVGYLGQRVEGTRGRGD